MIKPKDTEIKQESAESLIFKLKMKCVGSSSVSDNLKS